MLRFCFEAMGTEVDCLLEAGPGPGSSAAFRTVEREFRRLESLLSRFRGDSELSVLNRDGSIIAGADLLRVTQLGLAARRRTGGRFDPTVHDALAAAGYDRTFAELPAEGPAFPDGAHRCGGAVEVDEHTRRIELQPGVRLDLGGIAKGDAVERACDLLASAGPCLVNAGGDLAVRGKPPGGRWTVAVSIPDGELTTALASGAIATSGRDRRRWRRGGEEHHHLIDPATGAPSRSDLLRVTVLAPTAVEAEVLATSLFLAGERAAVAEANAAGIPCALVTRDSRTVFAGGFA